jgi:hypothetical protein
MRLAQADAAIDEQRVVSFAGMAGHLDCGGLGELIALSLDETIESEVLVDRASEDSGPAAPRPARHGRARIARTIDHPRWVHRRRTDGGRRILQGAIHRPGSHIEYHIEHSALRELADQLLDAGQRVVSDPLDDIRVRGEQSHLAIALDSLQRPQPGIELLYGQLALEHAQTAVP